MRIIVVLLQSIIGFLIGYGGTWAVNFGAFHETGIFSLGVSVGIWGIGVIFMEVYENLKFSHHLVIFINTFIGAIFGAFLVTFIASNNIIDDYVIPMVCALIGFYYTRLIGKILKQD